MEKKDLTHQVALCCTRTTLPLRMPMTDKDPPICSHRDDVVARAPHPKVSPHVNWLCTASRALPAHLLTPFNVCINLLRR